MLTSLFQTVVVQVPPAPVAPPAPPAEVPFEHAVPDVAPHLEHLPNAAEIQARVAEALARAEAVGAQGPFVQFPVGPQFPEEIVALVLGSLVLLLLMVVGAPIAKAIGRRIEQKSSGAVPASNEVMARLERIEHAVETMAVEIERISEGQRFTTRLLTEQSRGVKAGYGEGRG